MNKTKRTQLMKFYKIKEVSKGIYSGGFFDGIDIAHKYYSKRITDRRINDLARTIQKLKTEIKNLKKIPSIKSIENRKQRERGKIKRMNEAIDFWRNKYERLAKTTPSKDG